MAIKAEHFISGHNLKPLIFLDVIVWRKTFDVKMFDIGPECQTIFTEENIENQQFQCFVKGLPQNKKVLMAFSQGNAISF